MVVLVSENNNAEKNITSRMKLSVTFCIWVMVGKYYYFLNIYRYTLAVHYRLFTAYDIFAANRLFSELVFMCVVITVLLTRVHFFFHTHVFVCIIKTKIMCAITRSYVHSIMIILL